MAQVTGSRSRRDVSVVWDSRFGLPGMTVELLRAEVGRVVGIPPEEVRLTRSCPQCGSSAHGRPVVLPAPGASATGNRPPWVSLSRAGEVGVVVVSGCGAVGVDIERLDAPRFARFDEVALHEFEIAPGIEARATTWVRKESLLKATGDGLQVDPRLVRLSDPDQPPRLVEWSAPGRPEPSAWMQDIDIDGHRACVTVLSDEAPRLTLRRAAPEVLPR